MSDPSPARRDAARTSLRNYVLVTGAYWADTAGGKLEAIGKTHTFVTLPDFHQCVQRAPARTSDTQLTQRGKAYTYTSH